MELRKAVELFLGEYKPSSQQAYTRPLTMLRDWIGPARLVADITPAMLTQYFQVVVNQRGYAPATLQKHAKTIKTFFNWCVRLELIDHSPARVIRARKPPRRISREKAMHDDELSRVLDYTRYKTVPRDYALILFLADTGCRRGGAAGLKLTDIDFASLKAVVTEKGDKARPVAFSEKTASAISRWIGYRSLNYKVKGLHVFSSDGLPMRPENVSLIVRRACKRAGVRTLSAHSLRHRKGHQFADARIAPSIAATALGHADAMTTLQHYYPDDWETAEKALRELMNIETPDHTHKIIRFKRS
jgi:integrase